MNVKELISEISRETHLILMICKGLMKNHYTSSTSEEKDIIEKQLKETYSDLKSITKKI